MGFTIEDMRLVATERYGMKFIAGEKGWSNSINWVMLLEDTAIIHNFSGKELAVTTGLGFDNEKKLKDLVEKLVEYHAAGLIISIGDYIAEIPESVKKYCDENDFPLMTVSWKVYLVDMIKDLSTRIFLESTADEEINRALIHAIEVPDNYEWYKKELLPYFDVDGTFQIALFTTDGLDEMDTVERKRLSYRLQIYLENITHNGSFFYYDSNFVLVVNDVLKQDFDDIVDGMLKRAEHRMPGVFVYAGVGSGMQDISSLSTIYHRAKAAVRRGKKAKEKRIDFDEMGVYRLLYSVDDKQLLKEMSEEPLRPLIEYDKKHNSNYVQTLELYLKYNGSIQAVSEAMYTHRNTVIYRISNIKKLLQSNLETTEERQIYQLACQIRSM